MISPPLKISLIYGFFGVLWIFFSDKLLYLLAEDALTLHYLQILKGWFYIAITTVLLYCLMKADYQKVFQEQHEKTKIFMTTISVVQHILNNFLNNMTLFKLEAEHCEKFDKNVLALYDEVIEQAESQIERLSSVTILTQEEIKNSVYPKHDTDHCLCTHLSKDEHI